MKNSRSSITEISLFFSGFFVSVGSIVFLFFLLPKYPDNQLIFLGIIVLTVLALFCIYEAIYNCYSAVKRDNKNIEGTVKYSYEENEKYYLSIEYLDDNHTNEVTIQIGKAYYEQLCKEGTCVPLKRIDNKIVLDIKKVYLPKKIRRP